MRTFAWLTVTAILLAALLILVRPQAEAVPAADAPKDGVFVHLTAGPKDAHRVLMGLQMANIMAESRDVLVYCDIQAIEVLLKDAADIEYSHFPSAHKALKNLMDKKVTVMACPGCLKAAGKTAADLRDGVKVAEKEAFFDFTKGRILTLDY
jgi:predicted peroxiredoxin